MSALPDGVVTFLLTDIENSTKMWEESPQEMQTALARHDALLGAVIERYAGTVVKSRGEGDALFAVFSEATQALEAALVAQRALQEELWPLKRALKVRIALQTGEAQLRDSDYFGTVVNRAARLRSAGYGGQILISSATYALVRDRLPAGASLKSLGIHRLKDLTTPDEIFQVLHPELVADFPPLRTLNTLPNNLPSQMTRFIGREPEIEEVCKLLTANRVVTLLGAGGTGKTRLALQVAAELMGTYPDGIWLIELATTSNGDLLPQLVTRTLGIEEQPDRTPLEVLVARLVNQQVLLVLDNCEHVITACADLVMHLLRHCKHIRFLTTSREALEVVGEVMKPVPPLSLPHPRRLPPLKTLLTYEAVRLFVDRASLVLPTFALTNHNALAVAEICHRLDGIPLAIELAAARIKALTPEQIVQRLKDLFHLLASGSRGVLPRHQTLRAMIDWSYDLLSEAEQMLFRRLSIFAGGFTLEAAETICSGGSIETFEVLDLLTVLVGKSLVVADVSEGHVRYRLLQTLRQYGSEKLSSASEEQAVAERHYEWALALLQEARPKFGTSEHVAWIARLDAESDNLGAAMLWALRDQQTDRALRYAALWGAYLWVVGRGREGREQLAAALALPSSGAATQEKVDALGQLSTLELEHGTLPAAVAMGEAALGVAAQVPQAATGRVLANLTEAQLYAGNTARAAELARALLQSNFAQAQVGWLRLAQGALYEGNLEEASAHLTQLHAQKSSIAFHTQMMTISFSALIAGLQGQWERAHQLRREVRLLLGPQSPQSVDMPAHLFELAAVEGDLAEVQTCGQALFGTLLEWHVRDPDMIRQLDRLAQLLHGVGAHREAVRLLGAAHGHRMAMQCLLVPFHRAWHEPLVAAVKEALGAADFTSEWAIGERLSVMESYRFALEALALCRASR